MSFPSSPTNGQLYTTSSGTQYQYVSDSTAWKMASVSPTRLVQWTILTPATGNYAGPKMPSAATASRVNSYCVDATNCTWSLQDRTSVTQAGTSFFSADQTSTVTPADATTFASSAIPADTYLWLKVNSISGTPSLLSVTLSMSMV